MKTEQEHTPQRKFRVSIQGQTLHPMSVNVVQPLARKLSDRLGIQLVIDQIIREEPNETVAKCVDSVKNKPLLVHRLKQMPQNVRIHIEFETSQLKEFDCKFLPQVVATSFDDDEVIVVTELPKGNPTPTWIGGVTAKPIGEVIALAASLFECLKELHDIGVEHLDVCATNVVVHEATGRAQLIRSSYLPKYHDSVPLESAFCFSPEQAGAIDRDVNASTDLYSAGVVLFLMLTGRYPFTGKSIGDVLLAHMTQPIPSLCHLNPLLPSVLGEIVEKLLQKDPTARYQTAEAVLFDLNLLAEAIQSGDADPDISIGLRDHRASIVEPALVGRTEEIQAFRQSLREANSGDNSLVFLEGVSGSGKSRALGECSRYAVENGWLLFRGQCIQETSRKSMAGMEGVARGFSNQCHEPIFENSFLSQFDGEWADLVTHFPTIRLPSAQDNQQGAANAVNEQRSLRTLSSFLNALGSSQQPALIILDDFQWADELTLRVLAHWWKNCSDQRQYVMVVIGFRGDEVSSEHLLRQLRPSGHIKLNKLTDDDIRQLAASMSGTLPRRALDLVVAASAGSPFMASAVVRGLVESNAIVQRDGVWEIHEQEFEACQSSSQAGEFLTRRLELLDPQTIELLSAAAALGREFDIDAASHLVSSENNIAIRGINEARNRNLLWYRQGSNRYVFSHDRIRNALLNRVPAETLGVWHRLAAEYLLTQPSPNDADVAYHYNAAGVLKSALPFALRAAETAATICNFSIAKTQFQIAHRSMEFASQEQKYAIETGLGRVLMQRGEYEDVESHFESAASHAHNELENAQALGNLAEIQRRQGNIGEASHSYEESLKILGYRIPKTAIGILMGLVREALIQVLHTLLPSLFLGAKKRLPNDRERLALRLFSGLSHSYYNGRSGLTVFFTHLYSLNLAERFLPSQELALLYLEHLGGVSMLGLRKRVERYAERSRQIRKDDFPPLRDGLTAHYLSVSYFCLGDYDRAISEANTSIRMLERVGDFWKIHMSRYQLAAALYHKGYFREAIEESRKNYESGLEKGDFQASGIILDVWARA